MILSACLHSFNNTWTLCRNSVLGPVNEWKIQDCIDVHKLLETIFGDQDVANSKFQC